MSAEQNMSLTDNNLRIKRISIPHAKNATWPIEKKIEAVTTWLALGNLRQVAAVTGVSYGMIKQWRIAPWWKDVEAEIVASRRIQQGNKLAKVVDKALEVVDDRLSNGDFKADKFGQVSRRPVGLRDATTAANMLMQRAAILEKLQKDEKIVETQVSIQDQLANLANEFAKMNNRGKAMASDIEFTEIEDALHDEREPLPNKEIDNALYDKWEAGLQEGSGEVYESSFGSEEEDGAERGSSGDGETGLGP